VDEEVYRDEERLDIGGAVSYGWRAMVDNIFYFVVLGLIFLVVEAIFYVPGSFAVKYPYISAILGVIGLLIAVYIHLAITVISLKVYAGEEPKFGDIFAGNRYYWRFLGADILYGLLVLVGLILCVIPGIYFAIKYHFYGYLIVDQDMGVMDSLKKSGDITRGAWWDLLLLFILFWLISLGGLILCGIGVLFAWPIVFMGLVYAYKRILDTAPREVAPGPVGPPGPPIAPA